MTSGGGGRVRCPVLRMHVVRGVGVGYYVGGLVPGRAEGSVVAGESPGEWTGQGCAALGLRGTVEGPIFAEVLAGRDPRAGVALRDARGNRPVSGFDLTFCAPKSVSVLHLLAPRELGTAAVAAHVAAVGDALAYVERNGLGVRRSRSGQVQHLAATGAVAAGFVHRTSRALDPHLHSHVVTANVAEGVDGTWSSLDSRRLHLHRRATGAVYDAALRHHLTAAAGVAWDRGPSGGWEVAGVDPVLRRLFSQRSASIDEHAARTGGRTSTGARKVAFHADRPEKDRSRTVDGLRSEWRRRAAAIGLDTTDLVRVVGRGAETGGAVDVELLDAGLGHLAATRTRVSARDLVAVADAAPAGVPASGAEQVASALQRRVRTADDVSGATRVDAWSPDLVARVFRLDPESVLRVPDGRAPSGGLDRPDDRDRWGGGRAAGRHSGRSVAFGSRGPDVPDLRR